MLPMEINTTISKKFCNELSDSKKLTTSINMRNSKIPNLDLCKQLIFSCTENVDSCFSKSLHQKCKTFCVHSCCSPDISPNAKCSKSANSTSRKKRVSFGKNDIKFIKDSPTGKSTNISDLNKNSRTVLKGSNVQIVSSKNCFKKRNKSSKLKCSSKKNTVSKTQKKFQESKKTLRKQQKLSIDKIVVSQKRLNGVVKNSEEEYFSTKNFKKHVKTLTLKLKNDFYCEKLLNILNKARYVNVTPSNDKNFNLIVCLLSMIIYKKYKSSLLEKFSNEKLKQKLNSNKQELTLLKKRIVSLRERLENWSSAKYKEEKKYLRVSLKKLPDIIFNHFKNQKESSLSKLPDYVCDYCKTVEVSVVIPKIPDQIFGSYQKGKPIMISNLPSSLLNSTLNLNAINKQKL